MAIIKAKARQDEAVSRVSESGEVYTRATRDGSLFTCDWKTGLIMEGRGFQFNVGDLTTAVSSPSTTIALIDKPDWAIGIPAGTSIMPIYIEGAMEMTTGTTNADELDILVAVDQDTFLLQSSGSADTVTPTNMNNKHSRTSSCWVNITYTGTTTDPVYDIELAHVTQVFEEFTSVATYWMEAKLLYQPKTVPIINGPALIAGIAATKKGAKMFWTVQWLELPTSLVRAE